MAQTNPFRIGDWLPFWSSLILFALGWFTVVTGGYSFLLVTAVVWYVVPILDQIMSKAKSNVDPETGENTLAPFVLITKIWPIFQFILIFGGLWVVEQRDDAFGLQMGVFFAIGMISGTVGINYSHELMHQKNKFERNMADVLLAMTLYSHFRSEHLLVHHHYVGTPRDPVTARYNEGFHRFFRRVIVQCWKSAFRAEKDMLRRKGLPWYDQSNPFWRYWMLQGIFLALAIMIGGVSGLILFLFQALTAVFHLELVNYIEHYGLTRKHLGGGKYEPVLPHHSWNAEHRAANWMLINLQRHSDHHYKPNRRYPLLQTYGASIAPQLPYSYPFMGLFAFFPSVWRRVMNHRVQKWRAMYYPEITDWSAYNKMTNPKPR